MQDASKERVTGKERSINETRHKRKLRIYSSFKERKEALSSKSVNVMAIVGAK
jgi:hypothetical protein